MSDIIFARPRFHYASYADLYQLIDLSGFRSVYIDEVDPQSDNVYILTIFNQEVPQNGYPGAKARIILWDLEYHLGENALPQFDSTIELWAADKWYAAYIGARYVPMGSHPGLRMFDFRPALHVGIDVAFIGFIEGLERRMVIRHQLEERGLMVSKPVAWGEERHWLLDDSKVYLHVHQHAAIPAVPPLRMVVAAAYSLPVVSERFVDAGIFSGNVYEVAYAAIAEAIPHIPREPFQYEGQFLHQLLCVDYTFRKSVEAAL